MLCCISISDYNLRQALHNFFTANAATRRKKWDDQAHGAAAASFPFQNQNQQNAAYLKDIMLTIPDAEGAVTIDAGRYTPDHRSAAA